MSDLSHIRAEIDEMRRQVDRQRREIVALKKAGIAIIPAEDLLARMLSKVDGLCGERDRIRKQIPGTLKGKVLGGRQW